MPNTTPLAVELYQRAGDGLVPLLVRATGGDTTDIEALIATAIKQHNEDPEAHPDIRRAIKEAGGGLVTTPVLTLADTLPVGLPAELGMTAAAGLNGAHVQSFRVTVNNTEPMEVSATDNAATYTFTPTGNAGGTLTVNVVALDNFGNRSPEATKTAMLYERNLMVIAVDKSHIGRSLDKGYTWETWETQYQPIAVTSKGIVIGFEQTSTNGGYINGNIHRSIDWGKTWQQLFTLNYFKGATVTPDDTILIAPYSGNIRQSRNHGVSWEEIPCKTITTEGVLIGTNGTVCLYGGGSTSRVAFSSDNCYTWKYISLPNHFIKSIAVGGKRGGTDVICVVTAGGTRYTRNLGNSVGNAGDSSVSYTSAVGLSITEKNTIVMYHNNTRKEIKETDTTWMSSTLFVHSISLVIDDNTILSSNGHRYLNEGRVREESKVPLGFNSTALFSFPV